MDEEKRKVATYSPWTRVTGAKREKDNIRVVLQKSFLKGRYGRVYCVMSREN
jgi:hypothetical protein